VPTPTKLSFKLTDSYGAETFLRS